MVVVGGLTTYFGGNMLLREWAQNSGIRLAVGPEQEIEFTTTGTSLVYYESPQSVPTININLTLWNPFDERIKPTAVGEDISFNIGGWQGRALFELDIDEPGVYRVLCKNANVPSDDVVVEDRIVFFKTPNHKDEADAARKFLQIIGASITGGLAILLYVIHYISLAKHRAAG